MFTRVQKQYCRRVNRRLPFFCSRIAQTVEESCLEKQTVLNRYDDIRTRVTESNVMAYGDFECGFEKLSSFVGYPAPGDGPKPPANATGRKV